MERNQINANRSLRFLTALLGKLGVPCLSWDYITFGGYNGGPRIMKRHGLQSILVDEYTTRRFKK